MTGDFVFRTKVFLEFKNTYDACALLVYENENVWAKLALENSDMPCKKPAVVSVVTNRISDDCFGFQYSLDGKEFNMVRVFTLPVGKTVKVGFEAQAPAGEGGERHYTNISITNTRVENVRAGY